MTKLLEEHFISSWSLVADLKDLTRDSGDLDVSKHAKTVLDAYKFPVQSMVIGWDGKIFHSLNANDLLESSSNNTAAFKLFQDPLTAGYVDFLQKGIENSKQLETKEDAKSIVDGK